MMNQRPFLLPNKVQVMSFRTTLAHSKLKNVVSYVTTMDSAHLSDDD